MSALGTTMPQTHSQAHTLPLKSSSVEDPTKLSEPPPPSTKSSLSSPLEVTKPEQVRRTHFRITQETRTALYTDLTTRLSQDELWEYEYPEALVLEKCLRGYVDAFHIHLPILHVSSLTVEETPSPLILIMCAIGALYRLDRKLAISMYRKASQAFDRSMSAWLAINESLVVIEAFNPPSDEMSQPKSLPVWMMQARFLLAVFGTLNGNAGLIKRAFGLLSAQWTDCHLALTSLSVRESVNDTTWEDWIERESSKRIFYGIIILSHMLSTAYGFCPAFSAAQIATLEMPGDQDLWDAPSERQWLLLKHNQPRGKPLSVGEAMSKLMHDQTAREIPETSWKWSPFATAVAMYAVATQIWYISSAKNLGILPGDHGNHTILSGPGDIMETEVALNRCRDLLMSAKNANEVTWSDDDGPMLFNCMAVLRVAYSRACMLTATLDRFILLRETRGEIVDAITKYLSIDQPRSESITKAVARSVEGLFVPARVGVLLTLKTAALTWWVDHAIAGWDTALFVTRWIHAIEQAELSHDFVNDSERQTIKVIHRLMTEAQVQFTSTESLAAAVTRFWAPFFTDTWVWGVTPRIGFVLQELAKAYEEASRLRVQH